MKIRANKKPEISVFREEPRAGDRPGKISGFFIWKGEK
jgi:hypothetical protein